MKTFVQFGAGNIGRSFIGRQFSEAGFEVVFVDVDVNLIAALNSRQSYSVVVKQNDVPDIVREVHHVRAVAGSDSEAVVRELVNAEFAATSVGLRALTAVFPVLAKGLLARRDAGRPALDVIIAENLRSGATLFREGLAPLLPSGFNLASRLGLVETSIGKMVPLMPAEALVVDPLVLFSEPYDTLIADRKGFLNSPPPLRGLKLVDTIDAYVDRKLFMHNMSHAAAAYLGYVADPSAAYVWQVMEIPSVVGAVRKALEQSASALASAYKGVFTAEELAWHAEELLERYRNKALGDTIFRVGRDVRRKLSRDDRLVGACLLAAKQGLPFDQIAHAVRAALEFRAVDNLGRPAPADETLTSLLKERGVRGAFYEITGLNEKDEIDRHVAQLCLAGIP